MNAGFPCTSCGACCKNISNLQALRSFDSGNGVCKFLDTTTNLCTIYATRPEICQVDGMYNRYYATHYTKEQFYALNIEACKVLQEKEGVEESLRL